jgi:hypothetical protein
MSAVDASTRIPAADAFTPGPNDIIGLHIPQSRVVDNVVFYFITIVTPSRAWSCSKRYSQFEALHESITATLGTAVSLPAGCQLPPKRPKVIISHTDPQFVEERRVLLEFYSRKMNTVREVATNDAFRSFFNTDALDHIVHVPDDIFPFPDDAEITSVSIPSTRRMSDHVLYHLDLSNHFRRRSFQQWSVLKRFTQFHSLEAQLRQEMAEQPYLLSTLPQCPSRHVKWAIDHSDAHFIEHRRVLLEDWMNKMIKVPQVAKHPLFLTFCGIGA